MKICPRCNNVTEDNMNFCNLCGNPLTAYQPYTQPVQPRVSLGLKITGMALSIEGFGLGLVEILYTLIGLIEEGMAFGMAFAFSLFVLPMCIAGFILSIKCTNAGDTSAFSRVGKGLGLAGIILAGVSLFIGFASLAAI